MPWSRANRIVASSFVFAQVGPAAPQVAKLVAGAADKEATLSKEYGGSASAPGLTDTVSVLGCIMAPMYIVVGIQARQRSLSATHS
jgi:hypothetical protein